MQKEYWEERWSTNNIGFHRADVNPLLQKYWSEIDLPKGAHVLVPLCGKTVDMLWLAEEGCQVTGIELSPEACKAFFEEAGKPYEHFQEGPFEIFKCQNVVLYAGDFFQFEHSLFGRFDAIYDRAALVALPSDAHGAGVIARTANEERQDAAILSMRQRYISKIHQLTKPNTQMLLLTWAYDQNTMPGPPFSIDEEMVNSYYGDSWEVSLAGRQAFDPIPPHLIAKGLSAAEDLVFTLKK